MKYLFWNYLEIIEQTESHPFIKNHRIDKINYADHLPIKFEIREEFV